MHGFASSEMKTTVKRGGETWQLFEPDGFLIMVFLSWKNNGTCKIWIVAEKMATSL